MLSQVVTAAFLAIFFTSCGSQVDRTEHKSFILGVSPANESYKPLIKRMVFDYNQQMGFQALEFSDAFEAANSPVVITKGLEKRDGKVGWGQWFSETERRSTIIPIPGTKTTETVNYRMQVEFDEDFLADHAEDEKDGQINLEIRKLFAHEIGHGLHLGHVEQESDVMYFDISGEKNFDSYWPKAKAFFGR